MKATKKPIEVDYYPITKEFLADIDALNTPDRQVLVSADRASGKIFFVEVQTPEGLMIAYPDQDVLMVGIEGEVYPCKKDIFAKTYDIKK